MQLYTLALKATKTLLKFLLHVLIHFYGATYIVIAPEHPLVDTITTDQHKGKIANYRSESITKNEMQRTELNKDKSGVFTGSYAINPINNKKILYGLVIMFF